MNSNQENSSNRNDAYYSGDEGDRKNTMTLNDEIQTLPNIIEVQKIEFEESKRKDPELQKLIMGIRDQRNNERVEVGSTVQTARVSGCMNNTTGNHVNNDVIGVVNEPINVVSQQPSGSSSSNTVLMRNLIEKPTFVDNGKINPKEFLDRFEEYWSEREFMGGNKLTTVIKCLKGNAKNWAYCKRTENYQEFREAFLDYYWSEDIQSSFMQKLLGYKYRKDGKMKMSEYFIKRICDLRTVAPLQDERKMVTIVMRQFPVDIRSMWNLISDKSIKSALQFLRGEDVIREDEPRESRRSRFAPYQRDQLRNRRDRDKQQPQMVNAMPDRRNMIAIRERGEQVIPNFKIKSIKFVLEGESNLTVDDTLLCFEGYLQMEFLEPIEEVKLVVGYSNGLDILKSKGWKYGEGLGIWNHGVTTPFACRIKDSERVSMLTLRKSVGIPMSQSLPHIYIRCQSHKFLALLDSESEVTCIDERYFDSIRDNEKLPVLPVTGSQLMTATVQHSSRIKIQTMLEYQVEGIAGKFLQVTLVAKGLIRPLILGADWIESVKGRIDFDTNMFYVMVGNEMCGVNFATGMGEVNSCSLQIGGPSVEGPKILLDRMLDQSGGTQTKAEQLRTKVFEAGLNEKDSRQLSSLLCQFQQIFSDIPGRTSKYIHKIKLHNETPFIRRSYPIPHSMRLEVREAIQKMLELGVIKRESSPFSSPMTIVRKKSGGIRICLDARWLNEQMIANTESPCTVEDILQSFRCVKYMTTIHLRASFWQIPLDSNSTKYTAFLFEGKSYTYQVLPFGLKTAVGSFTRGMDVVLGPEVRDFTVNYVGNLLVVSSSIAEHLQHLRIVLNKIAEANMTVNLEKTFFFREEVKFLGHILSTKGISTDPEKISAIKEFPQPRTVKQLRSFIGLCNYYRRFALRFSHLITPLTHLLRKGSKWEWGYNEKKAFDRVKALFLNTVILQFPDMSKIFYLEADASDFALGVVVYQTLEGGKEHGVIGFASRVLQGSELVYTVTEKELLAIIFGVQKFRSILLGNKVIIKTDHYALEFLKQCRLLNDRLTKWTMILNEYDYVVKHVPGRDNVVTDVLSRYPTVVCNQPSVALQDKEVLVATFEVLGWDEFEISFQQIREAQKGDRYLRPIYVSVSNRELIWKYSRFEMFGDILIFRDEVAGRRKLALPNEMISRVVNRVHQLYGHFGITKILQIIKANFYFRKMFDWVKKIVRSCDICQKVKHTNRQLVDPIHPIIVENPGDLVTVDYFGPLPQGRGSFSYIFVVIDSFSKFVKLYALRRAQAKVSAQKIVNDFSRIIKPNVVLSNHGTQFISEKWKSALEKEGIKVTYSSIRHSGSNPTKRVMRELGRLFRTYCRQSHSGWANHLQNIELLFNVTPHLSTGYSPFEIIQGRNPPNQLTDFISPLIPCTRVKPIEQIRVEVREKLLKASERFYNDKLNLNDLVLLREHYISDAADNIVAKFCKLYSGPYRVVGIPHPNVYTLVDLGTDQRMGNYNINNLKLYYKVVTDYDISLRYHSHKWYC